VVNANVLYIARALALNPKFIICDESVSSLDVSVQASAESLKELQAEFNLTMFISHDLSVVKFISDRILVMRVKLSKTHLKVFTANRNNNIRAS